MEIISNTPAYEQIPSLRRKKSLSLIIQTIRPSPFCFKCFSAGIILKTCYVTKDNAKHLLLVYWLKMIHRTCKLSFNQIIH